MLSILFAFAALPLALANATPLPIDLPEGFAAEVAAAPPLVSHPIMATLGEPGQLFVGDAPGVNLNKAELLKQTPNRVLLLQDTNGDGVYDESTVFADKMTFPQGGVWLDGSLYVASPPGIWKLTDTDRDGVADEREMLVGYFDFTGNAADVHGPFLHPNGRLYWCHGRKGHDVKQRDGTPVHTGLASGIWSCRPDGSEVRWHALGSGDNPVEIDFTPEGEIIGTENIFFTNPRGDTIVHWLRGGVYPREDQLKAIAGLPRTLDVMPVVHNFGHVAVSGCAFYRSGAFHPDWRGHLFVAHFNTQRVTRMEVARDGASFKAVEREFFKLRNPDAHLTDVLEDRDGSLLVVDTGGWFRIGCPASLMAKPDITGAVYRVRKKGAPANVEPWGSAGVTRVWERARKGDAESVRELTALLGGKDASVARAAGNALASIPSPEAAPALVTALEHPDPGVQLAAAHALGALPHLDGNAVSALLRRLDGDGLDAAVEHQAMDALLRANQPAPLLEILRTGGKPALQRRALIVLDQLPSSALTAADVLPLLEADDPALARKAADLFARHRDWVPAAATHFTGWLANGGESPERLALMARASGPWLSEAPVREVLTALIESPEPARQRTALSLIAASTTVPPEPRWTAPLQAALGKLAPADVPLALEAIAKLADPQLHGLLRDFAADEKRPLTLRVKALAASLKAGGPIPADSFALLTRVLGDPAAGAARLEAARLIAKSKLNKDQLLQLAPAFGSLSPLEIRAMIKLLRQSRDAEVGKAFATALKDAASLGALPESEVRGAFSSYPPEVFAIVAPALQELAVADDARRRKLETLPALVLAKGRPAEGRQIFESGKAACSACHRVGEVGSLVGPNLSTIGQIRTERDLLESIFFPSASLARDFEAHTIETATGQSFIGVIRRNLPDTVVIADASGQEHTLSRAQIISMEALSTSLMPPALDQTLTEQELLDLVAFLRSRR
ncbi:MAG: HEAT repeat domain-containing protein [Verrucomicrobiota bacterium]|nr:HEAT repeat domain-containing protein [Verrucomicrobiota bacterium]